jgi:predicted transcriptional regulator
VGHWWDDVAGRLLLWWAVQLQKRVASKRAWDRMQERRNRAVRAAERRGMPVEEIAARLGLTQGWVRQVLKGKRPPEVPALDEAA